MKKRNWRILNVLVVAALLATGTKVAFVHAQERGVAAAEPAAMKALDEFMTAFNARDGEAWAATLNYPHVRIAGGEVRVWQTAADYIADRDFEAFAQRFNWHHSEWTKRDVIQASADKVHIAVTFTRYDAENKPNAVFQSLYIVTNKDGHWGTQARSSFAP